MSTLGISPPGGGPPISLAAIQAAASESSLIIHNPPDIPPTAEVIGVCAVPQEYADHNKYGWIVGDFMSWKAIFDDVGTKASQTWLSTIDIAKFLQNAGMLAAGEDASTILGGKNQIASLPTDHHDCAESVFKHIRTRALAADKKKVPLLIMIFAPVTPEHDIIFDFGGSKTFLTIDKIRKVIRGTLNHENLQVTLVTPSPFTAGWMCNPSLFPPVTGMGDSLIRVISKSCGAALADPIIEYHTTRRSPLLSDGQKGKAEYDNIMPVGPTPQQVGLLHRFHRKIHETLEQRLSPLGGKREFNFDTDKDAWRVFDVRRGMSLDDWKTRCGPTGNVDVERVGFLDEAFGNWRATQLFHIKYLVQIELETCFGDWGKSITGGTKKLFESFIANANPDDETVMRVFDALEFRSSSMTMAHILAKALSLPSPGPGEGVKCRYWTDGYGQDHQVYLKLQHAFSKIQEGNLFEKAALFPSETRHEFNEVRFLRASRWLAAAVATRFANGSKQEVEYFVQYRIAPFIRLIRVTQCRLLLEDPVVCQFGREWIASLPGLGSGSGMPVNAATLNAQAQPFVKAQGPTTLTILPNNPTLEAQAQPSVKAPGRIAATIPPSTPKTMGTYPFVVPSGPSRISEHGIASENVSFGNNGKRKISSDFDIEFASSQKQKKIRPQLKPYLVPAKQQTDQQDKGSIGEPSIVEEPVVKVVVSPLDEGRIIKPVNKAISGSFEVPATKPAEVMAQGSGPKSGTNPHAEPFVEIPVKPINNSVMGSFRKSVEKPKNEPNQKPSEGQTPDPAAVKSFVNGLSKEQMEALLERHPKLLLDLLSTALGDMNLDGKQVTIVATPSVVATGSAPTTTAPSVVAPGPVPAATASSVATSGPVTAVTEVVTQAVTEADRENGNTITAHQVAGEVGIHDPAVETSPAPAALVNPTPPQTPITGRTIGTPAPATGPQARATPQQPSGSVAKLAGPEDFWKNVKW